MARSRQKAIFKHALERIPQIFLHPAPRSTAWPGLLMIDTKILLCRILKNILHFLSVFFS